MRRFKDHSNIHIVPIEQDSDEWLEWRNKGVGSSDVALLLHPEPLFDRTVGTLWKQRVGYERSVQLNNEHIKRGKELEPIIRDKVNKILGTDFKPECIVRADTPHLRASLDGLDENINALLEIKAPSDTVFAKYMSSWEIPRNYYYQMQYQMLVANVDYGIFSFYNAQYEDPFIIHVKNNHELQLDIERRCALFWGAVENKIPVGWQDGVLQMYHIRPLMVVITCTYDVEEKITSLNLVLPFDNEVRNSQNKSFIKILQGANELVHLKDFYPNHRIEIINLTESPFAAGVHEVEISEKGLNEAILSFL